MSETDIEKTRRLIAEATSLLLKPGGNTDFVKTIEEAQAVLDANQMSVMDTGSDSGFRKSTWLTALFSLKELTSLSHNFKALNIPDEL